ncbi:hypothetical protein QFC21_001784 [Naganishia friedmannii]|uniref:Uncharacterized protein n=1 Tax=Naganishia friedmannii TaxID=89922 RepID=A0ACC2W166_9TREE|nr:hypothetical protein QFC21_001784 [Naganishia friedmannii]
MQSLRSFRAGVRTLPLPFQRTSTRCLPPIYQLSQRATTRPITYSTSLLNTKSSTPAVPDVAKEIVHPHPPTPPAAPVSILDRLPAFARPIKPYLELTRIDKPIGTLLLYWPCAWSITMASTVNHLPITTPLFYLALFGTGAIIMRGAGCTINDMWDSKIDKAVGLAFNWGALLGWSAVAGSVDWSIAAPLYAGGIAWCVLYDTIYAHQDKQDDVLVNVKSTALRFGENSRTVLTGLGTTFVSLLTYAGYAAGAGPLYYLVSCLGAAGHLTWQLRRVDFENRADCWEKFVSNGRLGGLVWVGMFVDYLAQVYGLFGAVVAP